MPRTTIGGDDPSHELSDQDKDALERKLREEARRLLGREAKKRKELLNRAINISRRESDTQQHH
jgi:hypothetical protein